MLNKVKNIYMKVKSLIVKCYVKSSNDDSNYYPVVIVSYLGKEDIVTERISPYGLYSNPSVDLPGLRFSIFGQQGNQATIVYSQNTRFKNLKDGEVLVGNEKTQAYIKFNEGGDIEVKTTSLIKLITPEVEVDGNLSLTVNGNVDVNAGTGTVTIGSGRVNLDSGGTLKKIVLDGDPIIGGGGGTVQASGNNYST